MKHNKSISAPKDSRLFEELSKLIENSRRRIVVTANSTLVLLYWQIGKRISAEVLKNKRAEYGKQIVLTVSTQLKGRYGCSFEGKNLRRMVQFAEQFSDEKIVVTASRQLRKQIKDLEQAILCEPKSRTLFFYTCNVHEK